MSKESAENRGWHYRYLPDFRAVWLERVSRAPVRQSNKRLSQKPSLSTTNLHDEALIDQLGAALVDVWPNAAGLFWARIRDIGGAPKDDVATDLWSGEKGRCKEACRTLADLLFAAGHGKEALSASMLATDPTEPQTFEIVLPQLA